MDTGQDDRGRTFTRRALVIGALQGGLLTVLGGRLAFLQIMQGQRYQVMSDNNRINIKVLPPSRGQIIDRNGVPLAVNGQSFRVLIIPEQTMDLEGALSKLQKLISLSQSDIRKVLKRAGSSPGFVPQEVKDNLGWDDVARIEVNMPDLPGVAINEGEVRTYPFKEATAHVVGYVGAVSQAELTDDPVLSLPGFKIGKTGIEKAFDNELRGRTGSAEVEVNVMGREVRELSQRPAKTGDTVKLTIDIELQQYILNRLSTEKSASAVVMDVKSGEIYALASYPSFDPNLFTTSLPANVWEELLNDPGLPLNNKAAGGQYPPGSTFKMVTALAALEEGIVTRNSSFTCPGYYDYGGDRFHCWKRGGHGRVDLIKALAESCDTYFYELSTQIGIDKIAAYARKLGLGERLGIALEAERPGLMPTKAWKMGHFGKRWQPGESIVASIGQGYILTTPLQLAVMTARLVNGGIAVKPWLTASVGDRRTVEESWSPLGVSHANLALIKKGMDEVIVGAHGTARASAIAEDRYQMGGKTGTAQVRRITAEDRLEGVQNADLPWKHRHHALFVGYAPINDPRYACCIVVEHGGGGSAVAAPIARDVLYTTQKRNPAATSVFASLTKESN